MCLSNEAAAIKLAERDNLVGELVDVLSSVRELLAAVDGISVNNIRNLAVEELAKVDAALSKAREGAQS